MNKKGQVAIASIMIGFLVVITILAIAPSMKEQVSGALTGLDCTNTSLTAAQTGTCITVDWLFFGFVGVGLVVGIGYLIGKQIKGV